jgi:hypothetical protein
VQIWIALISALSSFVIGAAVAYIAWRQWRTANEKLVIELFDQRFSLYQRAHDIIGPINASGKATDKDFFAFSKFYMEAAFLFGNDVVSYLDSLKDAINRLITYSSLLEDERDSLRLHDTTNKEKRRELVKAKSRAFEEVTEFYNRFPEICRPYLKLDQSIYSKAKALPVDRKLR